MDSGIRYYRKKMEKEGQKSASQEALAAAVGISRTRLSFIENGRAIPTVEELERIAAYLEVTPGHLYAKDQLDLIQALGKKGA